MVSGSRPAADEKIQPRDHVVNLLEAVRSAVFDELQRGFWTKTSVA
jgi:hypothetical protein